MATFVGTRRDFDRYIGPAIRNLIPPMTKAYKRTIGCCQHCGNKEAELDAAHKHGFERKTLIQTALDKSTEPQTGSIDLKAFMVEFRKLHEPIENVILVLCKTCHRSYDATLANSSTSRITRATNASRPIELEPENHIEFKERLLLSRIAIITIHYNDGRIEEKTWNANRLSRNSNVLGNLRSRPELRAKNWQDSNIRKVCVVVI